MKELPRKPIYVMKKKRPDIDVGRIRNHPQYQKGEAAEMKTFRNAVTHEVLALVDVNLEEIYLVPQNKQSKTPPEEVNKIYRDVCERRNIPYLDRSREFPIAVPASFYLSMCEEFGLADRYEETVIFQEMIQEKWDEWKTLNGIKKL